MTPELSAARIELAGLEKPEEIKVNNTDDRIGLNIPDINPGDYQKSQIRQPAIQVKQNIEEKTNGTGNRLLFNTPDSDPEILQDSANPDEKREKGIIVNAGLLRCVFHLEPYRHAADQA